MKKLNRDHQSHFDVKGKSISKQNNDKTHKNSSDAKNKEIQTRPELTFFDPFINFLEFAILLNFWFVLISNPVNGYRK